MQVQPLSPADQLACEGVEVAAGAPLLLVHCATDSPLNLEEHAKRPNDFGIELEVSAHAVTSTGKQLALEHAARVSEQLNCSIMPPARSSNSESLTLAGGSEPHRGMMPSGEAQWGTTP